MPAFAGMTTRRFLASLLFTLDHRSSKDSPMATNRVYPIPVIPPRPAPITAILVLRLMTSSPAWAFASR